MTVPATDEMAIGSPENYVHRATLATVLTIITEAQLRKAGCIAQADRCANHLAQLERVLQIAPLIGTYEECVKSSGPLALRVAEMGLSLPSGPARGPDETMRLACDLILMGWAP